ncbi:potassium-transporting ATPase subunit C [Streptomyces sp. NPDC050355]|uniref:potassium-transporting ATPase subunit C n=1 Tax=Streptomyces sp. NPDC050355 TaxID=3365609 RepID=UPI00378E32A3
MYAQRHDAAGTAGRHRQGTGRAPGLRPAVLTRTAHQKGHSSLVSSACSLSTVQPRASRLDPAISPAYAYEQVNRVAKARHLTTARVRGLVADRVQGRVLGFLGRESVNVVELNHALAEPR